MHEKQSRYKERISDYYNDDNGVQAQNYYIFSDEEEDGALEELMPPLTKRSSVNYQTNQNSNVNSARDSIKTSLALQVQIASELNGPANFVECSQSRSSLQNSPDGAISMGLRSKTSMASRNNDFDGKIVLQALQEGAAHKMSFISAKMGSIISNLTDNLTSLENIKDLPSQIHKSISRCGSP